MGVCACARFLRYDTTWILGCSRPLACSLLRRSENWAGICTVGYESKRLIPYHYLSGKLKSLPHKRKDALPLPHVISRDDSVVERKPEQILDTSLTAITQFSHPFLKSSLRLTHAPSVDATDGDRHVLIETKYRPDSTRPYRPTDGRTDRHTRIHTHIHQPNSHTHACLALSAASTAAADWVQLLLLNYTRLTDGQRDWQPGEQAGRNREREKEPR